MTGDIYDYENQRWTWFDTDTDTREGPGLYRTVEGVAYEINPDNPDEYRNRECDMVGEWEVTKCQTTNG